MPLVILEFLYGASVRSSCGDVEFRDISFFEPPAPLPVFEAQHYSCNKGLETSSLGKCQRIRVECLTHLCLATVVAFRVEDLYEIGAGLADVSDCVQFEQIRSISLVRASTYGRVETRCGNGCAPLLFSMNRSNFDLGKGDAGSPWDQQDRVPTRGSNPCSWSTSSKLECIREPRRLATWFCACEAEFEPGISNQICWP